MGQGNIKDRQMEWPGWCFAHSCTCVLLATEQNTKEYDLERTDGAIPLDADPLA